MPVHEAATAYTKGASIRNNAERHAQSRYTIRLDFEDFFPSFCGDHVTEYFTNSNNDLLPELSSADISFIRRIVCRHDLLTIGAPSSPGLTNAMMFPFDAALAEWCVARDLIYTRYADDLFISALVPGALVDVEAKATELAAAFPYADLVLNREKTAHLSRKYRRSITGLVITSDQAVSIGRANKIRLKADIYSYSQGKLKPEERSRTAGYVAFVRDVEPNFYQTLIRKYGRDTIEGLQTGQRPSLKD